jgi:hypothetical protein
MLKLEITDTNEKYRKTVLHAETMEGLMDKLVEWTVMSETEEDIFKRKGTFQSQIESGWWLSPDSKYVKVKEITNED